MFKIAVNNLVQSIGGDVYLPSPSTAASKSLSVLSLVERKDGLLPLKCFRNYHSTGFTLQQVMEDGDCEVKVKPGEPYCTYNRESAVKVSAALEEHLKGIFEVGVSRVNEITIKTQFGQLIVEEADKQSLVDYVHSRRLNMRHALVSELSKTRRRALCVVTGVVKTTEPTKVSAAMNYSMDVEFDEVDEACTPVEVEAMDELDGIMGGELKGAEEKKSIGILKLPAGATVAYQLLEMAVDKQGNVKLMVSHGAKGGFQMSSFLPCESMPETQQPARLLKSLRKSW